MKIYMALTCWITEATSAEIVIEPEFFAAESAEKAREKVETKARSKIGSSTDRCRVFAAEINLDRLRETLNEADSKCLDSEFLT